MLKLNVVIREEYMQLTIDQIEDILECSSKNNRFDNSFICVLRRMKTFNNNIILIIIVVIDEYKR